MSSATEDPTMKMKCAVACSFVTILAVFLVGGQLLGQGLPTSQPNMLQIFREEVKVGHEADHSKTEAGWPAAFEKAKFPYFSLGLVALTGTSEAWFLVPRSEEHTSELQSRSDLVCRLLLEKKKKNSS